MKRIFIVLLALLLFVGGCDSKKDNIIELENTISNLEERNTQLEDLNKELTKNIKNIEESTDVNKLLNEIGDLEKSIDKLKDDILSLEDMNNELKEEKAEILNGIDSLFGQLILHGFDLNTKETHYIQFEWPFLYVLVNGTDGINITQQELYRLDTKGSLESLHTAPINLEFRVAPDNETVAILTTYEFTDQPMLLFIDFNGQELKRFGIADFDPEELSNMNLGQWKDNNSFIIYIGPNKPNYLIETTTWEMSEYKY